MRGWSKIEREDKRFVGKMRGCTKIVGKMRGWSKIEREDKRFVGKMRGCTKIVGKMRKIEREDKRFEEDSGKGERLEHERFEQDSGKDERLVHVCCMLTEVGQKLQWYMCMCKGPTPLKELPFPSSSRISTPISTS